ncbi:MAG: hypothetical protein HQL96_01010 [Magnetococcales bacterium]|nr:hypothetical protein [Magnetococcales bacterium]
MKRWMTMLAAVSLLFSPTLAVADAVGGAGVGAMTGALVGSLSGPAKNRGGNTLIGALAGGLLGYAIGNEEEKQGQVMVNDALEFGTSYNTVTWVNPDSNVSYGITPQPARTVDGRICRELELQARIDGKRETVNGLTCRDDYGQWRLVDRFPPPAQVVTSAPPPQTVIVTRPVTRYVVREPVYYPSSSVVIYRNDWPRHRYRHDRWDRHWGHDWRYRY